ncbi:hypothetical protein HanXRQr2_Chr06g0252761 [Helianthus annuus]|uniref:Uncharacterized protein n=1 Tax=Helianthus annuus TaxID=4232 RepID=A0A9K3IRU0_HELAN|nr:hypothetical protein HanXRQr2_Chr06g0252761 [Helianthus annuus]
MYVCIGYVRGGRRGWPGTPGWRLPVVMLAGRGGRCGGPAPGQAGPSRPPYLLV